MFNQKLFDSAEEVHSYKHPKKRKIYYLYVMKDCNTQVPKELTSTEYEGYLLYGRIK